MSSCHYLWPCNFHLLSPPGCIFIYLTAASPPSALGATNGLAQTVVSVTRCLGPISATSLYALSIRHHWLGGNFIYVVMCSLVVAAMIIVLDEGHDLGLEVARQEVILE